MSLPEICTTEQPYQPQRFVPRPQTEDAFWAWLQQAREDGAYAPLLLLQGPPGSGKSWLLQKWHAAINAGSPQEELRAVYLPWARWLAPGASGAQLTPTLLQKFWRAFLEAEAPGDLSVSIEAIQPAVLLSFVLARFFQRYPQAQGLVLLVDGLDRLEASQVRAIENAWLQLFVEHTDPPIWMVLVHYGRIDNPRLRLQGQKSIFLAPLPAEAQRWRALLARYQQALRVLGGTDAAFDFRHPLLNAYWETQRDELSRGTLGPHAWRLALACLFTRRAATRPWAAALQARNTAEDWFDSPAGRAFTRVFRARAAHQDASWYKIRVQDVAEDERRLLHPLLDGSFWQVDRHFYRINASLARFFQDAVHLLSREV